MKEIPNTKLSQILERVSYHAVYDKSILDALEYAHQNGFAGIQLAVETPHLSFESLSEEQLNKITSFIEKHGTHISIHAPDEVTSLFQHSQYLLQGVQDYFGALFDFAAQVKTRIITLHLGVMISYRTDTTPVIRTPEEDLKIYKSSLVRNLNRLLELANNRFVICVENEGLDNCGLSVLQNYLDKNKLALCWDLAKNWNNPITEEFFLKNLPHIKQVHLSDTRQDKKDTRRRHLVIGTGELDFIEYLNKLSEVDVLDYCIEVRPREKAKESLEALKKMIING